ncbi:MAG: hypothetical protein QXD02_04540 [Candidatus Parvarchaeum sp.]|jgi:hypothetical protein|nr:hypothetical protein [Candidatus Parvarchaeum tengchongense]MCW1299558.1 hypothetical protein [Candidatus Parvarchaeum tengchongense]
MKNKHVAEEAIVTGDFGEAAVALALSKKGIMVLRSQTIGIDLLAIDNSKAVFPTDRLIGISVKTRLTESPSLNVEKDIKKLKRIAREWKFDPWFAFLDAENLYIFPINETKNKEVLTNSGAISFSKLNNKTDVLHFKWKKFEYKRSKKI